MKLLRLCISAHFAQGFLLLLHSEVTKNIFVNARLDFKEDLVQYVLSDAAIESECINSNKNIDQVREIKELMC